MSQVPDPAAPSGRPPLDPMPDAPPEIVAAWMERIAKGALLLLWLLPFAFCHFLMRSWGLIPSWVSNMLIIPVLSVIWVVVAWIVTSPDPGDARWSVCLRWGVRIGPLGPLMMQLIMLIPVVGLKVTPQITGYLAVAYALSRYVYSAFSVASYWYFSRLARRLGDRALRINFSVLKWLCAIAFALMLLMEVVLWRDALKRAIELLDKAWNWRPLAPTAASVCFWVGFLLVFGGYFVWLHWRLFRRLRAGGKSLRTAATAPTTK